MAVMRSIKRNVYLLSQYLIDKNDRKNAGAMDLSLWGFHSNEKQHLVLGGCDCVELAEKYGTPLFVCDKTLLENNFDQFQGSLASHAIRFEILYSYKTNPVPGIIRALHDKGAGAEVVSPYELWLALKYRVDPADIVYNGPNKSDEGLRMAVSANIKLINVNSFREIDALEGLAAECGARPQVGVRISTLAGWGGQFGFKLESGEALQAFDRLHRSPSLQPAAIHFHLGTNLKDSHSYRSALISSLGLARELKEKYDIRITYLDLGGGLGIPTVRDLERRENRLNATFNKPHLPPDPGHTHSIKAFVNDIARTFREECKALHLEPPILLLEPGRALTGNTEILLATVGDFKQTRNGYDIALLDAGINIALPLTWEYHEIFLANRIHDLRDRRYGLAGPLCTPTDFFLKSKRLPHLQVGDILAITDTGAYFTSFANDFSFPRPAIVMVREGNHWIIRDRETFDDLVAKDMKP